MNNIHFTHPDFAISYSTQNMYITLLQCRLVHISLHYVDCVENYRQKLGNYGGVSGKFLKEFLEVFEELLAHAYSWILARIKCLKCSIVVNKYSCA